MKIFPPASEIASAALRWLVSLTLRHKFWLAPLAIAAAAGVTGAHLGLLGPDGSSLARHCVELRPSTVGGKTHSHPCGTTALASGSSLLANGVPAPRRDRLPDRITRLTDEDIAITPPSDHSAENTWQLRVESQR